MIVMYDIYLYDRYIGKLTPRGEGLRFAYDESALSDVTTPGISLSMPKSDQEYGGKTVKAFFLNLLPEGAFKRLVSQEIGASVGNDNALLGAIGGECPGAIAIWPEDLRPQSNPTYEQLVYESFALLFDPRNPQAIASATRRARLSLAGVQEKTALFRGDGGVWYRPVDGAVTSHILKQSRGDYPELLENELFCMTLASDAGLETADVGLPLPGIRVFCTQRFDRIRPAVTSKQHETRKKLHQEDFCQVLRVLPTHKYEAEGGPGIKRCARAVLDYSVSAIEDIPRLLHWVCFNYLIGNEDAHAKNLALLYTPRGIRLSPHYDLLSTEVYESLERNCAMKIGRATDLRNVQASDWKRVAEVMQLPWPAARIELQQTLERVTATLAGTRARCETLFGTASVYRNIGELVNRRGVKLAREISR